MSAGEAPTNAVTETTKAPRPALDEDMFQQLLAAAFVLQEHNDRLRAAQNAEAQAVSTVEAAQAASQKSSRPPSEAKQPELSPTANRRSTTEPPVASEQLQISTTSVHETSLTDDTSQTLAEIVATQHQIQMANLDLQEALDLIAERAKRIVHADGALIGLLTEKELLYRAGSGNALKMVGMLVPADACLTTECLRYGATLQSRDVSVEYRLEPESCLKLGIHGLIAVPVFYQGAVVGSLELHYARVNAFREPDIRTCQLMAGLVTEAKARAEEQEWKQALAVERETMREALAKLKPQLQRLVGGTPETASTPNVAAEAAVCEQCGANVEAHQLYCGVCGAGRNEVETTLEKSEARELDDTSPLLSDETLDRLEASLAEVGEHPQGKNSETSDKKELDEATGDAPAIAEAKEESSPWGSAAKAKAWLESLRGREKGDAVLRFWRLRRADVYLGIAVTVAMIAVIWAMRSGTPTAPDAPAKPSAAATASVPAGKTAHKQAPPEPKLSLTEKFLISLGLADPPPAPTYEGNPEIKVWVDLHTALYYCPGTELYGKTAKGKFTTQRDAQLDQFEPAARKACE